MHPKSEYVLPLQGSHYPFVTINRCLRRIGEAIGVPFNLSMYCARHTWASLSQELGVPISIISSGLGHDNEKTTQIYLASIEAPIISSYNRRLIDAIMQ